MWWAAKRPQRRGKTQAERLTGESGPIGKTQVGRPGDPATRRPGDPATRRPGDPATRRPGDPATRRPGDPATRRPGDPATRLIVTTASSGFVKCSRELVREGNSVSLPFTPSACASVAPVARSTACTVSIMFIASPPNLSPGTSREMRTPAERRLSRFRVP